MADATTTLAELKAAMAGFVAERQWEKYHSPKNLAMGLAIETAELLEHFQWQSEDESRQHGFDASARPAIAEELADVACYLLAMANVLKLDLADAIATKLEKNRQKYPAERFQGNYRRPTQEPPDHPLGPVSG